MGSRKALLATACWACCKGAALRFSSRRRVIVCHSVPSPPCLPAGAIDLHYVTITLRYIHSWSADNEMNESQWLSSAQASKIVDP